MLYEMANVIKEGVYTCLDIASKDRQEKTEREIKRLKRQIKAQMWKRTRR